MAERTPIAARVSTAALEQVDAVAAEMGVSRAVVFRAALSCAFSSPAGQRQLRDKIRAIKQEV